ncbi:hypothetical protein [Amycolatopsis pithecellobii]|uniref:L-2-amino-thiazoline-4-carboxylic acid hydrolase n=1 Tax=Amycolatopsis pithecellobii TaxID=664692 RepID=A0A6N7YYB8_9PSEU|nr:hypothetical protein [Amycolatopsis pithecellobii]MTD53349.1 hypothetical protein [Amycolatopsis pithecellobii]
MTAEPGASEVQALWWLHDGRWYQEVASRFGHGTANEINAAALRVVAVRVGKTVARLMGKAADAFDHGDLVRALDLCRRRMWPDRYLRVEYAEGDDPDEVTLQLTRNYALHMVRLAGSLEHYRCPCDEVRAGWLEGLGFAVKENRTEGCLRDGDPACVQVSRLCPNSIQRNTDGARPV